MNYRHAFHAGNHADVLKHLTLVLILMRLRAKETPFGVLDTHAGAGLYDLKSDEARRSPEFRNGIDKLWHFPEAPAPIEAYLNAVLAFNPHGVRNTYPGSPALIANFLRPQDRLAACELHPEEARKLRLTLGKLPNVEIHARDGLAAMKALLPLKELRGLVLIDPPYEKPDELAQAARAIKEGLTRFGHGVFLWWRPLKDSAALDRVDAEIDRPALRADFLIDAPTLAGPLTGSSVLVVNPPFGLDLALREALPALLLKLSALGAWSVRTPGD
ncbi:MAG: 23S rRNA (adenine(2030)-N(6))-methyltransferase RlmJ [Caulobacterales bacterium]